MAGKKVSSNQWPSSGGIGTKLKIARIRLNWMIGANNCGKRVGPSELGRNLKTNPKRTASARLTAGPANATLAGPNFGSLKLAGL